MAKAKKKEWQVEWLDVNSVTPYENNARKNDDTVPYLINSIRRFGFRVPLVIDKDGIVVCGHTRLKAALQIGMERIPCVRADDLTKAEIKAFRLADNKIAEMSEWDFGKLDVELEELKIDFDDDMTDFGFEWGDVESDKEGETEEDAVPETDDNNTVSRKGCVYQLGEHRLMCGDSTSADDVAKLMDGEKADIAFSSPPYNADITPTEYSMNKKTKYNGKDDNKSEAEYSEFLSKYIRLGLKYSKFVFCNVQSISNNKISLIDVLYNNKSIYADTIIWDKINGQPAMASNVLNSVFEYIHIFSEKANRVIGTLPFRGTLNNVLHLHGQHKNEFSKIHNATFSVEFAGYFISNFAKKSVLDQFGGTGTTLIAAEQLSRKCYMMELDEHYCDIIRKRWAEYVHGEGCNWEELTPEIN